MGITLADLRKKLTDKQQKFCREYLKNYDFNATQAYINAGYNPKSARSNASRLLQNEYVQAYLKEIVKEDEEKDIADISEITKFLSKVLRGEVKDTVVTAQGLKEAKTMVKDRLKASELLGKRYGMFVDVHEVTDKRSKIDELIEQIDGLKEKKDKK